MSGSPAEGLENGTGGGAGIMERVRVPLAGRTYDILVGRGLIRRLAGLLPPELSGRKLAVVADARVAALFGEDLDAGLKPLGGPAAFLEVPPGDASKNFRNLERLCLALIEAGIARDDAVIAFGGGMVGDLAGLAAALVRRGVGLVQIPTTLLAQVDSAVGGKTAINVPAGKNLIGTFHQPRLVVADLALLSTLAARERRAGLAEIAKYGLIADSEFWGWLKAGGLAATDALDPEALARAVATSCRIKATIVAADEREETGRRFLLNLGHTFAHALEKAAGYDSARLLHGEAVAVGVVLAARLSETLGIAEGGLAEEIAGVLGAVGLPSRIADLFRRDPPAASALLAAMGQDKKIREGRPSFVLLRRPGEALVRRDVPEGEVLAVLAESGAA